MTQRQIQDVPEGKLHEAPPLEYEKVPAAHCVQLVAPDGDEEVPATHGLQLGEPAKLENVPGGQSVEVNPSPEVDPAGTNWQTPEIGEDPR